MRKRVWKIFGLIVLGLAAAAWLLRDTKVGASPDRGAFDAAVDVGRLPLGGDVVASWGYKETSSGLRRQLDWERERFGRALIREQGIKSLAELPDMAGTYFRFKIVEERYLTEGALREDGIVGR